MEAADYTELLKQAEEELGKTPGAYCSRKVAIRAMELLQAHSQVQYDWTEKNFNTEVDKWVQPLKQELNTARQQENSLKTTIERQAEAIKRLETEKTQRIALASPNQESAERELARMQDLIRGKRDRRYGIPEPSPYQRAILEQEREKRRRLEAERAPFRKPNPYDIDPLGLDKLGPPFQDFPSYK